MKRLARYAVVVLLTMVVLPLAEISPAGAAPLAPTLTAPADFAELTANPVLQWTGTPTTVRYRVQIDDDPGFGSLAVNLLTVNTRYSHTADLPVGTLYWRVAGIDSGNAQGPFSEARSFTKSPPAGPTLSAPAEAATLDFPSDPPVFSWLPYAGAKSYQIEIDTEPDFIPPLTLAATSTSNASYTLLAPPTVGQTFYWRVRAFSVANVPSQYSEVRSYSFAWPDRPELLAPPSDNTPENAIEQVEFVWSATQGAVTYDVQVSPNDQFTSGTLTVNQIGVKGTRFSPSNTLAAGAYYWRVRAKNQAGAAGAWSDVSTFYRAWPAPDAPPLHRITLLSPANDDFSVTVPTFSWTPVRLGSRYELTMSTDINFSVGVMTCLTDQTTFTPITSCNPAPGTLYYWRVRARDLPNGSPAIWGLYSPTYRFQYFPAVPNQVAPADGSLDLTGPVILDWDPVPNIGRYRATVIRADNSVAEQITTYATSWVPQSLDPAEGPFRWYVQTVDSVNRIGLLPNIASWWTFQFTPPSVFAAAPDALTPPGTQATHVPTLSWSPVALAADYTIFYSTPGSPVRHVFRANLEVNAYADPLDTLPIGAYDWEVEAYDADDNQLGLGAPGSFELLSMPASTLTGPAHCPPNTNCAAVNVTPTFTWDWDPDATTYTLYLATDPNFSNITATYTGIHFPTFRPTTSLPDAQAGQATYWYARPCYGTRCGPQPSVYAGTNPPVRAFRKKSEAVKLLTPAHNATVVDEITFTWEDYLTTNQAATPANDLEARNYQVQVSTSADMQQNLHTSPFVDQTTYTLYSATLPDGPLYWRVQAFDATGNPLAFSSESPDMLVPRVVNKTSSLVVPVLPAEGASVGGAPVFAWESQDYAARYELEVYRNVTEPLSTTNRVLTRITPMTAWVPTTALPSGEYGWRIRRLDQDGRAGPWTAPDNTTLRRFSLAGNQVTLLTPSAGTYFPNNNQGFTWTPANGATQYRFQTSVTEDFAATVESVTTVMTSWHSTVQYANGSYFWRVLTIDAGGNVTAISAPRLFGHGPPPPPAAYYHSLAPARILDSRRASQIGPYGTPWGAGTSRVVDVAGFAGVPADAVAVTLNVTVTGTTGSPSYLKIWPTGAPLVNGDGTAASAINWTAGTTIANSVTVGVGTGDSITVRNAQGTTNVIVDVVGYYDDDSATGDMFTGVTPRRIVDSRPGAVNVGVPPSKWGPGVVRNVTVAGGSTTIPADADAVVLNVTATGPTAGSFLTIWPKGGTQPTASSLNFSAGQTLPNAVTAKVGADGQIRIFNNAGSVDVIVDVVGYFKQGTGAPFRPLTTPIRIQDSRGGATQVGLSGAWGPGSSRALLVAAEQPANIPLSATAVLLNTTVNAPTAGSYLTIYPQGVPAPTVSSLNWVKGQTVANAVTAKLGTQGRIVVVNAAGSTHVLMDVFGYYGP